MAEFVHHHIILDHKIPSKRTANTIKKNIARDGNCCHPKTSTYLVILSVVIFIVQAYLLAKTDGLISFAIFGSMWPNIIFGSYNAAQIANAKKHMMVGSPDIICLGSESSTTTSAVPWNDSPGLSQPWADFIAGCRRYESLLEKIPENELVSDSMFFATVEDIYALFEHTYMTGQTIQRHRMETEFATLRTAIEQFDEFIEKSSRIYASLRFNSNNERRNAVETNLAHMNEVAQSKISSLLELENPMSKAESAIAMSGGEKKAAIPVESKKKASQSRNRPITKQDKIDMLNRASAHSAEIDRIIKKWEKIKRMNSNDSSTI